jgi:hypothetical protein
MYRVTGNPVARLMLDLVGRLSIGAVEIDHTMNLGLKMAKADAEMYRDKRDRRAGVGD